MIARSSPTSGAEAAGAVTTEGIGTAEARGAGGWVGFSLAGFVGPEGMYCSGKYRVNLLPSPGLLTTRISPPRRPAISRLIDNPRPVPPNLRLVPVSASSNG